MGGCCCSDDEEGWDRGERLMWLSPQSHFLWHLQDEKMKSTEGSDSSCGQLTHHIGMDTGKGKHVLESGGCAHTCMVFGLWQRRYYCISRHTGGMQGEIPAPWVVPSHLPSPCRYDFILPFPPQPGNFPVCVAPGGNCSVFLVMIGHFKAWLVLTKNILMFSLHIIQS